MVSHSVFYARMLFYINKRLQSQINLRTENDSSSKLLNDPDKSNKKVIKLVQISSFSLATWIFEFLCDQICARYSICPCKCLKNTSHPGGLKVYKVEKDAEKRLKCLKFITSKCKNEKKNWSLEIVINLFSLEKNTFRFIKIYDSVLNLIWMHVMCKDPKLIEKTLHMSFVWW